MKKTDRQLLIKQIVLNQSVSTQEELLAYLMKEGVKATQATISRDIKELHLIKMPDPKGGTKYTLFQQNQLSLDDKLRTTLGDVTTKFTCIEFVNLLTTIPGNAHVVGALLDELSLPDIVGTVAGNDTILILSPNREKAENVHVYLKQFIQLDE